ncbi:MAG: carbamoyl phosphate synthase large subunit, partial [Desulfosudaceae bacterium]
FAVQGTTVYILEANPRASRTVPLVSKVCNVSMARIASQIMLGAKLTDFDLKNRVITHFGVKEAVFPFNMFPEVDPLLGPEMRSTGEVLGMADSFGLAFFRAQEATKVPLPLSGTVLITLSDADKLKGLEAARLFHDLGFAMVATPGTLAFLAEHGIPAEPVKKLGHGKPDIVDIIKNSQVSLVFNTPSGKASQEDDSYIRKAAINYQVPYITTTAAALSAAKGISARRKGQFSPKSLQEYHAEIK